jgi:hypothetical protein
MAMKEFVWQIEFYEDHRDKGPVIVGVASGW